MRPEILRELAALFDFSPKAADDPYVRGVRAQIEAALAGQAVPPLGAVSMRPDASEPPAAPDRAGRAARLAAAARRNGYQITLLAVGVLYWIWPEDLIPDDQPLGRFDDAALLIIVAFLAGRVSKRTPALADLPGYLARAFRRRFRGRR